MRTVDAEDLEWLPSERSGDHNWGVVACLVVFVLSLQSIPRGSAPSLIAARVSQLARWLRRPETWVLMVAVAYGLTQLLSLRLGRFLTWDEAVYISEVSPFAEPVGMGRIAPAA